jgi:predicted ABC-type transport system involved in lysophospholipase L1 biosynthesis ATPase subunit
MHPKYPHPLSGDQQQRVAIARAQVRARDLVTNQPAAKINRAYVDINLIAYRTIIHIVASPLRLQSTPTVLPSHGVI